MAWLKRTPIYPLYKDYGAKTINFGGWELPVQFKTIKEEHVAVRTKAGLFDVSHMGEISVKGENSLKFLQKMMTNDIEKLTIGGALYTAMCYENGGTVDDLIVYRLAEEEFLLVVNAANIEKDYEWLMNHNVEAVQLVNLSDQVAQLALQGPFAEIILQKISTENISEIKFFKFKQKVNIDGIECIVSRTGYTGEDGFEIYCDANQARVLWTSILRAGEEFNILPIGLGARDTLRFEAKLALYGHELTADISPLEAGLDFVVKTDKFVDFIGKKALKVQQKEGVKRRLVGLQMIDRGIPRNDYKVYVGEEVVGHITSGTHSPTYNKPLGLALVKTEFSDLAREMFVEIRANKFAKAKVVSTPFYKRRK
ncbi:glycine cleavage system aminomethyltransferase GcvT [Bacillus sp. Marseille-P3661]|uniref:glycine cleavage system aminomethyltransferase GcvT n=1 Tax=Bacillus sp. Marseille-P3661 TaxID=1936234 RepID=UPI000C815CE6|nr:glycine cleavage system aminomethyltransferase GcvT [Bacillus sp. Marseille-P3661]